MKGAKEVCVSVCVFVCCVRRVCACITYCHPVTITVTTATCYERPQSSYPINDANLRNQKHQTIFRAYGVYPGGPGQKRLFLLPGKSKKPEAKKKNRTFRPQIGKDRVLFFLGVSLFYGRTGRGEEEPGMQERRWTGVRVLDYEGEKFMHLSRSN